MSTRAAFLAMLLIPAAASAQPDPSPEARAGLEQALKGFPPLIVGGNVHASAAEAAVPRACPAAGGRVEQKGGPTLEFLGSDPQNPALCRMKVGPDTLDAWYGIWATAWPGAASAQRGLERLMHGKTGDVVGFDTVATPGTQWHDLIRQDGVEEISLLGKTYRAVKLAHYREGFGGTGDRSVSTVWKDLETGLPMYRTYQHIAGQPDLDDPLIPTAIVPGD